MAMSITLKKICDDFGLTAYGVRHALEQYQNVISEITHGMLSKLTYEADDILRTAQDRWCDTCELMQAQQPRVLTLEEATGEDECWFEFRPANIGRYADCYLHDTPDRTRVYFTGKAVMSLFDNADYGKTWRCWSAKPTDAQREETPWDKLPKEEA